MCAGGDGSTGAVTFGRGRRGDGDGRSLSFPKITIRLLRTLPTIIIELLCLLTYYYFELPLIVHVSTRLREKRVGHLYLIYIG